MAVDPNNLPSVRISLNDGVDETTWVVRYYIHGKDEYHLKKDIGGAFAYFLAYVLDNKDEIVQRMKGIAA